MKDSRSPGEIEPATFWQYLKQLRHRVPQQVYLDSPTMPSRSAQGKLYLYGDVGGGGGRRTKEDSE
jgi:hypothetical protein